MQNIPAPVILKLNYKELKQLTLKPLTAGIYLQISSHTGKKGEGALTLEKLVAFLLTYQCKEEVMGLDMDVRTLEERLELLLPARLQDEIYAAVSEAWERGGLQVPKGLPLRRQTKGKLTLRRLTGLLGVCIFYIGLGYGMWQICRWIYLSFF